MQHLFLTHIFSTTAADIEMARFLRGKVLNGYSAANYEIEIISGSGAVDILPHFALFRNMYIV